MPVEVEVIRERTVATEVRAGGTLDPAEVVQVTNRVAGIVERVRFKAGDAVQAGQILIEIEPDRFRIASERAAAALRKAEAQATENHESLTRRENLAVAKLITGEELAGFRSRAEQAEADLALSRAGIAQAKLDERDASVAAPISGTIESRSVRPGEFLPVGTVIATQVQRLPMRLRASVTMAQAALLTVGQDVRVLPSAGGVLVGRLVLVGAAGDAVSRTVEVEAEVTVASPGVTAGDFAELIATASDGRSHPAIPQSALRATDRGYIAYVAEHDGDHDVARARVVEAGLRSLDGWVEVRSGLAAGESLIVLGADGLRDGLPIEPRTAPTKVSDTSTPPAREQSSSATAPIPPAR